MLIEKTAGKCTIKLEKRTYDNTVEEKWLYNGRSIIPLIEEKSNIDIQAYKLQGLEVFFSEKDTNYEKPITIPYTITMKLRSAAWKTYRKSLGLDTNLENIIDVILFNN